MLKDLKNRAKKLYSQYVSVSVMVGVSQHPPVKIEQKLHS
jgi:hypothetical protein